MSSSNRLVLVAAFSCVCVFSAGAQNQTAPDNSANNKNQTNTAQKQSSATSDRQMTANIRKAIVADKNLSTYGHNVKIITQNGAVTLKGPVHSDDEKHAVETHAADVAGKDHVTNQLTVKQ